MLTNQLVYEAILAGLYGLNWIDASNIEYNIQREWWQISIWYHDEAYNNLRAEFPLPDEFVAEADTSAKIQVEVQRLAELARTESTAFYQEQGWSDEG